MPRSPARSCFCAAIAAPGIMVAPLVALALVVACGPSVPPPEVNVAYGGPPATASAASSASAPLWPHLAELKTWTRANGRRFTSKGHYFGRLDADVLVNAVAAPVYSALQPGAALPDGGIVVKVHRELNGDAPGPMLAMEKRADGVAFVEMDAAGHVKREGRIEPCVGCHAQVAGQGEMFGIPVNGR